MDWEKVLIAYIDHIQTMEGTDFLGRYFLERDGTIGGLSEAETAALFSAAAKVNSENVNG